MTNAFLEYLASQKDHVQLADYLLSKMPDETRQVLGSCKSLADLRPLPTVSDDCRHRLTYADVPSRYAAEDLKVTWSTRRGVKFCSKSLRNPDAIPLDTQGYVGSSNAAPGACYRLTIYSLRSRQPENAHHASAHYQFLQQQDVLPHFCILGVFQNPTYSAGEQIC